MLEYRDLFVIPVYVRLYRNLLFFEVSFTGTERISTCFGKKIVLIVFMDRDIYFYFLFWPHKGRCQMIVFIVLLTNRMDCYS